MRHVIRVYRRHAAVPLKYRSQSCKESEWQDNKEDNIVTHPSVPLLPIQETMTTADCVHELKSSIVSSTAQDEQKNKPPSPTSYKETQLHSTHTNMYHLPGEHTLSSHTVPAVVVD